jgi:DNA-directed RNA polymerase subunit RPC12/RpoP
MASDARSWIEALTFVLVKPVAPADTVARQARLLDKLEREGSTLADDALASLPGDPRSDSARHAAVRAHRTELGRAGLAAYDGARLVSAALAGLAAGLGDPEATWTRLYMVGHALQRTYGSWQQFADAYDLGRAVIGGGHARPVAGRVFPSLPWKLDLQVAGPRPRNRYRRSICAHCGGVKELASTTPYVYCDFCGELCDYDFDRARAVAPPAPLANAAALTRQLEAAHAGGDRARYRALQLGQYAHLAGQPGVASPRIADPAYREAWIAYMADAITAFVFDAEATRLDADYQLRCTEVVYVEIKQQPRIVPPSFPPVIDAFEARHDRIAALYREQGLLERHPDRLTPALWRHLERATFVQSWLPLLDDDTAAAVLARLGLAASFDAAPRGKRARVPCHRCGVALELLAGARRVTCEHCGHRLELVGR